MDYKRLIGMLLILSGGSAQAQILDGVFSQGATELKNNAAQILALQAENAINQQGYEDVENGLTAVGDVHGAEYTLHRQYFTSLLSINAGIAAMPEIKEIESLVSAFGPALDNAIRRFTGSGGLTSNELSTIKALGSSLGQLGASELGVLRTILTPDALSMTDANRIRAIRALDEVVKTQYVFISQIAIDGDILIANRKKP